MQHTGSKAFFIKRLMAKHKVKFMLCLGALFSFSLSSCVFNTNYKQSDNADITYSFLLLENAIRNNDIETVEKSSQYLLENDPLEAPLIDVATWYLVNENYNEAKSLLSKLVKESPTDINILLLYAETLVEMDKLDEAKEVLAEFVQSNPTNTNAFLELAIFYINIQNYQEANDLFELFPAEKLTPISLYYHAQSLHFLGKTDLAKEKLLQAIKIQPDFVEGLLELAIIEENLDNTDKALEYYTLIHTYEPSNLDIISQLIFTYILKGDYKKAMQIAHESEQSDILLMQIIPALIEQGYYKEAKVTMEKFKSNEDDFAYNEEVLFYQAALVYEEERDAAEALKYLYQIPESSENFLRALRLIIELEISEEMYAEALFHVEKGLVETNKADIELFHLKIQLFYAMNQEIEALEFAKQEANKALEKTIGSFYDAEALYYYGGLLILDKKGAEGEKYLKKVFSFVPDHYEAMNSLAYYYAVEDIHIDEALELITEAVKNSPDKSHFLDTLAWVEYRMGEYKKAYKSINDAISLQQNEKIDPTMLEHYGFIALKLGYKEKAKDAFIKALEGTPENPEAIRLELDKL